MNNSKSAIFIYIFFILLISVLFFFTSTNTSFFSFKAPFTAPAPTASIINIPFKDKQYKEDFNQKFADSVINISQFEEDEKWRGNFNIDDTNYIEGLSSYLITSRDNIPTIISLEKKLDLSRMTIIKIFIFSEKGENGDNIKTFSLKFSDKKNSFSYEYQIPNTLKGGWNLIKMPKNKFILNLNEKENSEDKVSSKINIGSKWQDIEKVTLELTARPNSKIKLSIDRLWVEKDLDYQKIFKISDFDMISLKQYAGKTYFEVLPLASTYAFLRKITSVRNFIYTVKIIPQFKRGTIAIIARTDETNNYGYYLELKGIDDSGWQLYKVGNSPKGTITTLLDSGIINNFVLEKNTPIWLRLKTYGNKISGYISFDGNDFIKLTEKGDSELASGGIGITQGGSSYLIESIDFKQ